MEPSLPPGPNLPKLVQTWRWMRHPYPMMEMCARRYGDMFTARMMQFPPMVMVHHPSAVEQVFKGDPNVFDAGVGNSLLKPFLGENSLLILDGERHLQQRRLMMPPFHGKRMRAYGEIIQEATHRATHSWAVGEPFAVHPSMQDVSLEVILRAVFGFTDGARLTQGREFMRETMEDFSNPAYVFVPALQRDLGPLTGWHRLQERAKRTEAMILDEVDQRRRSGEEREDILSLLLQARDDKGQPMTDRELHDQLLTLLAAGHETTATALAWAISWILRTPGVQRDLRAEVDGVTDPEALGHLPYLDAVCRESLRLYPIIPIVARSLRQPTEIMGRMLPAGISVAPSIYLVHRRPDLYPEPDKFKPERFLHDKGTPYTWLPFGGGVRRCLGQAFAMYEMKLVLATLFQRFDLEADGPAPTPTRRSVALAPSGGSRVKVKARRA